jgi:hypothetical protein
MAQITSGAHRGHAAGDTDAEKAASQLVSDIKYKVGLELKKKGGASHMNPAQVAQQYAQKLAASPAPGPVKALAKKKLGGGLKEDYNVGKLAQESIVSALTKVFVEGIEEPVAPNEYLLQLEGTEEKKYKIRVTDKKTGNNYVRMATREKIAELRANPNISSVEMTGYGEPSESERTTGSRTAAAKSGKDYDGDGKVESGAKEHAGAVHNAIQRKKGGVADGKDTSSVKEEFIGEEGQDQNTQKIEIKKGIKNKVDIFPNSKVQEAIQVQNTSQSSSLQKFQDQQKPNPALEAKKKQQVMLQKKVEMDKLAQLNKGIPLTQSYEPGGENLDEKITAKTDMGTAIKDFQSSKSSQLAGRSKESRRDAAIAAVLTARRGGKKLGEEASTKIDAEDPRSIPTKVNLVKNKLRAAGMKDPIVIMTAEETAADRAMAAVKANLAKKHGDKSILGSDAQKAAQAAQPKPKPQEPRKLSGYSMPGAPKEKSYND